MQYRTYRRKYLDIKSTIDACAKAFIASMLMTMAVVMYFDLFSKELISPVSAAPPATSDNYGAWQEPTAGGKPTTTEVKKYLRQIFGSKATVAWAIAQNECNSSRKEWPECICSWTHGTPTSGEHSVGLFQIHIARDEGRGVKVHWDKIPSGETLGEKEVWLKDWKNNILIAYIISKGGTDFTPWTAFTSGAYKEDL